MTGGPTAVDVQDLPGDVGRGLQEQDTVHDVTDLARVAKRGSPAAVAVGTAGRVEGGLDEAWADGVDPDARGGVVDGKRAGSRGEATFGQRGRHGGRSGGRDIG